MQLIDFNTEMLEMLELFDKCFKVSIIKICQVIKSMLKTSEKIESQQRNRKYKLEPKGNFRSENTITEIF